MKAFKFFRTPFNPRQYDVDGFTFTPNETI